MRLRRFGFLALFLGMVWLARADQPAYDEIELNRLQLEKWKKDSTHYLRLRHNLEEFLQLPPARQEALRQLDRDLREEDSATSAKLLGVLDRYVDWLNQLPEEDRQAVLKANSDTERLQQIKQIRNREWILRQPKNVQEDLKRLQPVEQAARIAQLRKREAEFRRQWELANLYSDQFGKFRNQPDKFNDDLRFFIKVSLEPMLSAEEKQQLAQVKDKWPQFEMKLVALVDKHPIYLPGPTTGIRTFKELPESVRKAFRGLEKAPFPLAAEGRWPDYAEAVSKSFRNRKGADLPEQLGVCLSANFSSPVRTFIEKELIPVLKPSEKTALQKEEGIWPAYPRLLQQLARNHRLVVPGMGLPGSRDLWEPFRRKSATKQDFLPELADRTLLDFAKNELTGEERAGLPSMSLSDPPTREEWKRAYFMRHPEILTQLKRQDIRKEKTAKKD
jgi:hypothetical protein